MNHLVQIIQDEDGNWYEEDDRYWHLIRHVGGDPGLLCTGEYFTNECTDGTPIYKTKEVKRGGITCKACLDHIRDMKAVKL